jgi:hypothetical protein
MCPKLAFKTQQLPFYEYIQFRKRETRGKFSSTTNETKEEGEKNAIHGVCIQTYK